MFAKFAQKGTQPQVYSVLDLAGAFNQLLLDDNSVDQLVLNTHKGLLGTRWLCFGIKAAPALFQKTTDKILVGIPNVFCYIDDVLVATDTVETHLQILTEVLQRFMLYNVQLNENKCQYFRSRVQYLGHILCGDGVRPIKSKIEAIFKAKKNV